MNNILEQMLNKYTLNTIEEKKLAIKEIIQEIVLCGLSRAGFFSKAAFCGGTALRIFYGLDRFSEDLDFSLVSPDLNFDLSAYFPMLEKEIKSYGLNTRIEEITKSKESNIISASLKGDTKEYMLYFYNNVDFSSGIPNGDLLKIKFEIDINPPSFATFEHKYNLIPSPYEVNLYDLSSLFSGKIHAILCRGWNNRVKGRDLYDYIFYIRKGASINLKHLKERLIQSNAFDSNNELTIDILKSLLIERFNNINYEDAKNDVIDFIKDKDSLNIWNKEFFISITTSLK